MRFPKLTKDTSFKHVTKRGIRLNRYYLDWSIFDKEQKEEKDKWYMKYHSTYLNNEETKILSDNILPNLNCDNWHRPDRYQYIYDKFKYVYMPENYFIEIKHFEKLALKEWNKSRKFDTIVRVKCLEVSIKSVELYFYMIIDAHKIYSKNFIDCEVSLDDKQEYNLTYYDKESIMLTTLYRYRFWKTQTGGGLVIEKCFHDNEYQLEKYTFMSELKNELIINNYTTILGCEFGEQKETILRLIKKHKRVEKLKDILNDK